MSAEEALFTVPDLSPLSGGYPGNIQPGDYTLSGLVDLLRTHKDNPEAIQFIADMLEE